MGETVAVTCTINDTAEEIHMSVNGRVFLFYNKLEVFTGDGVSVALLSNIDEIRVLSSIITKVSEMTYNLTCNLKKYTIRVSGMLFDSTSNIIFTCMHKLTGQSKMSKCPYNVHLT